MSFFVDCECGKSIPVTAAMAGGSATCTCGRARTVPRLSQLRQAAGQGAFDTNSVDVVRRMVREGRLPADNYCQVCRMPTNDTFVCTVVCERVMMVQRGGGNHWWPFSLLLLPLGILFWRLGSRGGGEIEHHGRNVSVAVPLRVCAQCRNDVARRGHAGLAELVGQTPATAELLREYPEAIITVGGRVSLPSD
jgi:hypothetical protein